MKKKFRPYTQEEKKRWWDSLSPEERNAWMYRKKGKRKLPESILDKSLDYRRNSLPSEILSGKLDKERIEPISPKDQVSASSTIFFGKVRENILDKEFFPNA